MIAADQPTHFPSELLVAVSSQQDGTMLDRTGGVPDEEILSHRQKFCQQVGVDLSSAVAQSIIYGSDQSYDTIVEVDQSLAGKRIHGDALHTKTPGVGLLLPVADCVATVLYGATRQHLASIHLGRDSTVAGLMRKTIDLFVRDGSRPDDLYVWMSPSARRETYRMEWFDHQDDPAWRAYLDVKPDGIHLDLPGFNRQQCLNAGIPERQIRVSPINTMTSQDYFSHSMGDASERFAVLAMVRS